MRRSYTEPVFLSSFCGVSVNLITATIISRENMRRLVIHKLSGKLFLWQAGRQASWRQCVLKWFLFRVIVIFFSCGYEKRATTLFCAVILVILRILTTACVYFDIYRGINICESEEKVFCVCVRATAAVSQYLWYSVVPFSQRMQHTVGTSSRLRTQDQRERSHAQIVTLQTKSVGWTFSG